MKKCLSKILALGLTTALILSSVPISVKADNPAAATQVATSWVASKDAVADVVIQPQVVDSVADYGEKLNYTKIQDQPAVGNMERWVRVKFSLIMPAFVKISSRIHNGKTVTNGCYFSGQFCSAGETDETRYEELFKDVSKNGVEFHSTYVLESGDYYVYYNYRTEGAKDGEVIVEDPYVDVNVEMEALKRSGITNGDSIENAITLNDGEECFGVISRDVHQQFFKLSTGKSDFADLKIVSSYTSDLFKAEIIDTDGARVDWAASNGNSIVWSLDDLDDDVYYVKVTKVTEGANDTGLKLKVTLGEEVEEPEVTEEPDEPEEDDPEESAAPTPDPWEEPEFTIAPLSSELPDPGGYVDDSTMDDPTAAPKSTAKPSSSVKPSSTAVPVSTAIASTPAPKSPTATKKPSSGSSSKPTEVKVEKEKLSAPSITSCKKGNSKITGTCAKGSKVVCSVNGKRHSASVSGTKWTVSLKSKLKKGDKIKVFAKKSGYKQSKTITKKVR